MKTGSAGTPLLLVTSKGKQPPATFICIEHKNGDGNQNDYKPSEWKER